MCSVFYASQGMYKGGIMVMSFTQRKTNNEIPMHVSECATVATIAKDICSSAAMMKEAASPRQIPKTHVLLK